MLLVQDLVSQRDLGAVTCTQLIKMRCWARDSQVLTSVKTPLELAYGRLPPPLLDWETANPEQLTCNPLEADRLDTALKKLAAKAHLEAKQSEDLRHDLALRIKSSDGSFVAGQRVFFWMKPGTYGNHCIEQHFGEGEPVQGEEGP